jgi:acyl carrier protein
MALDRDKLRDCVIQSLREIVGDATVQAINEQTDPICGLGLDSADGVALACSLSDKLEFDIPDKINPLVDDQVRRPRRVGEIVDLVHKLLAAGGERNDG